MRWLLLIDMALEFTPTQTSQLYFHADISVADDKVKQLLVCNRLKINKDKTQFVWLGTPRQLSRIRCQKITFGGADIQISTEAMCLGVLLDSRLTFADCSPST